MNLFFNNKKNFQKYCLLIFGVIFLSNCEKTSKENDFQKLSKKEEVFEKLFVNLNIENTNPNEDYIKKEILYYSFDKGFITATNEKNELTMGGVQGTESLVQTFQGISVTLNQETEHSQKIDAQKIKFITVNHSTANTFCNSIELFIQDNKIKINNNAINKLPTLTECQFKPISQKYKIQNKGIIKLTFNYTIKDWQSYLGEGTESQKTAKEIELNDNLTDLKLKGKNISDLSPIVSLVNLNSLNLKNNKISEIPNSIKNLLNLKALNLQENKISSIPKEIENLKLLKTLRINNNSLTELPTNVCQLESLTVLDLRYNLISTICDNIANLKNLKQIFLSNNKITKIPNSIQNLTKVNTFYIQDNNIEIIEKDVFNWIINIENYDL